MNNVARLTLKLTFHLSVITSKTKKLIRRWKLKTNKSEEIHVHPLRKVAEAFNRSEQKLVNYQFSKISTQLQQSERNLSQNNACLNSNQRLVAQVTGERHKRFRYNSYKKVGSSDVTANHSQEGLNTWYTHCHVGNS